MKRLREQRYGERRPLVACLLFTMLAAAPFVPIPCAGATYDNLPSGTPKGYIEFYRGPLVVFNMIDNLGFSSGGRTWEIWKKDKEETKRVATMRIGFHTERCRIAERPGKHLYVINSARRGIGGDSVYVYVKEGFVTLVEIDLLEHDGLLHKDYGLFAHVVGLPVPVRE